MNKAILLRQQVNFYLREFLYLNNYFEADIPSLSPKLIPESYLEIFASKIASPNFKAAKPIYLLASPEAYLKRLLVSEKQNLFYLGKAFRNNEPLSRLHNHEFTILEWYKINYTYFKMIKEIEQMIGYLASKLSIQIGIDFNPPWEYLTMEQAYSKFAKGYKLDAENFEHTYIKQIEPNLGTRGKPTFIYDFPSWQSPLAKAKNGLAERFELYINGVELINGWTELTDSKQQKKNLAVQNEQRIKYNRKPLPLDTGFIKALEQGMPECAGAAMGVDRLLMILGNYHSLSEVLLFPLSKLLKTV
jgi:elongation factor P--beta-lysine ligase